MVGRLDTIADPTRLAITRYLATHPGASAPEVARGARIHLNTARSHLAALERAGLLQRSAEGGRVGRPVVRFRLTEDWQPEGDELLGLSSLLASALTDAKADPARLRQAALTWGRRWTSGTSFERIEERLVAALRRLGFRAETRDGRLALAECPCPVVSPENPPTICALIDAVVDGVLEGSGFAAVSRRHDPTARRCSTVLSMSLN